MKFKSWDGKRIIELKPCRYCGSELSVKHIGNEHTKKIAIEVKCSKCRISRRDAAIYHGFDFIETVIEKFWNSEPNQPEETE